MTSSRVLVWFAERNPQPKRLQTVHNTLGPVDHQLDHLVQLGLLKSWVDFAAQDRMYSLKKWAKYQQRRAA